MRYFKVRGRTKARKPKYVQSSNGRWHRVDPGSNGLKTACGLSIGSRWHEGDYPAPPDATKCLWPECGFRS